MNLGNICRIIAGKHRLDLVHILAKAHNRSEQILPGDHHDLPDGITVLKCPHRTQDHRFFVQRSHHLIDAAHPGGGARRHDHRAAVFEL